MRSIFGIYTAIALVDDALAAFKTAATPPPAKNTFHQGWGLRHSYQKHNHYGRYHHDWFCRYLPALILFSVCMNGEHGMYGCLCKYLMYLCTTLFHLNLNKQTKDL